MSLPRYPEYKDSGARWLGEVPAHWDLIRLRRCVRLNPSKSEVAAMPRDLEVSFLPMEAVGDDGSLSLERERPIQEVETGYTYFRDGDVAFAKITPCFENGKGALMAGLSHGVGFGTTELTVARPIPGLMSSAFVHWVFRSPSFRSEGEASMYGAGGQKRVPDDFVRELIWAVPPESERERIATFLDRETTKIDALIAEQEKLLALLAEKRQATISHAVTRGLTNLPGADLNAAVGGGPKGEGKDSPSHPNVPMKDSGISWLGEVPAHWRVMPLKYLVSFKSGGTPSKENLDYWDGTVPWASAKDLKSEYLADTSDHLTQFAVDSGAATLFPAGVVLVVVRGMILARTFPVAETLSPMAINQDLKALMPNGGLDASYLAWLLRGTATESLQRLDEAGHGTKALRMDAWGSMELPVPPEDEQRHIVASLIDRVDAIDRLTADAGLAIDLFKERQSALISAAVTGKIDVRGEL